MKIQHSCGAWIDVPDGAGAGSVSCDACGEAVTASDLQHDASAATVEDRVASVWSDVLDEPEATPGMSLQVRGPGDEDVAGTWRLRLPSSTIGGAEDGSKAQTLDAGASLAGGTLAGDEGQGGVSLAGQTAAGEAGDPTLGDISLAGGTVAADNAAPGPSLGGATIDAGAAPASGAPEHRPEEFVIERRLAAGGMGEVFVARQVGLDRIVALKRPKSTMIAAPSKLNAFVREGTVTGDLEHPSIVPIYQNGCDPEGRPYYAMKLVRGIEWRFLLHPELAEQRNDAELAEAVRAKGAAMDLGEHLDVLLKVCDAVAFAHSRHVIHRDLKPENVMVGDYGEVQVMDWGLAVDERDDAAVETKAVSRTCIKGPAGTPSYMAPEMALGETGRIGRATDVYLLGAILYELLTGRAPHEATSVQAALLHAARNQVVPVRQLAADAPAGLCRIAEKALATDPADRQPDARAFQAEIREYLTHAQSLRISDKAVQALEKLHAQSRAELSTEAANARYVEYAEVIGSLRQALELWSANGQARDGLEKALTSFVGEALDGEDLGLAAAQLRQLEEVAPDSPMLPELRARRQMLSRRQQARKRNMKLAVSTAALLLLALVVGGVYSYKKIRDERDIANAQRVKAQENFNRAEAEKKKATEALALAQQESERAERNAKKAAAQAQLAEERAELAREAEDKAKKSEAEALAAKDQAERRRVEAEAARKEAEEAQARAEANLRLANQRQREALRNLADVDIQRAQTALATARNFPAAARHLVSAIRTMHADDTADARRMLAHVFQTSPRLQKIEELPQDVIDLSAGTEDAPASYLLSDNTTHPDGKRIAPADADVVEVLRAGKTTAALGPTGLWINGRSVQLPEGLAEEGLQTGALDAGGDWIALGAKKGRVVVLRVSDGSVRFDAPRHRGLICGLAFQNADAVLSGGADGWLRLTDIGSGEVVAQVHAHAGFVVALAVNRDGALAATGGVDGLIRVWSLPQLAEQAAFSGHTHAVGALAFVPQRPWLASRSLDATVRVWDLSAPQDPIVATLHVPADRSRLDLQPADNGRSLCCVSGRRKAWVWDLQEQADTTPPSWPKMRKADARLCKLPGGTVVCDASGVMDLSGEGRPLRLTNTRAVLRMHREPAQQRLLKADGVLTDGRGRKLAALERPPACVAVAADNAVIGTASGQLHVIQFEQTPPVLRQGASVRGAESLALSADASRLAVVTQAGGLLVGTPAELQPLDVAFRVHGAAWIGNTQLALRGLGDAVWVVDAGSGDVVRKLRGQQGVVQAISASDSGQWIACGTVDGEVRVWQVNPGTSVADAKPFVLARAGALGVDQVVIDEEAGDVICLLEDRSLRRFALPAGDLDVPVVQLWKQVERAFGPGSDDDRMVLNTRNSAHGVQ